MSTEFVELPVESIVVKDTAIRKVDTKTEKYIALVNDLKINGQESPIVVNKVHDEETNTEMFELIEGRHRLTALQELGEKYVLCDVRELSQEEAMGLQLRMNTIRIEQKKSEESAQLHRLVAAEGMTIDQLAKITGKSVSTLRDRLKLNTEHLSEKAVNLMDNKAINTNNALVLAKLPKESQTDELIQAAQAMPTKQFQDHVATIKASLAKGEDPKPKKGPVEFEARPKFRDKEILLGEIKTQSLAQAKYIDPAQQEAFIEGISYALSLDEETVTRAREEFELNQQEQARIKAQKEIAKLEARKAENEARIEAAKNITKAE